MNGLNAYSVVKGPARVYLKRSLHYFKKKIGDFVRVVVRKKRNYVGKIPKWRVKIFGVKIFFLENFRGENFLGEIFFL